MDEIHAGEARSAGAAGMIEEIRAFIDQHWNRSMPPAQWRGLLADAGWACPTWPREWFGRGLPAHLARVVAEELARSGAPGAAPGMGISLAGPTILEHGSDEQKRRWLRPAITGEEAWCQLFSEPGAGSDLAGSQTTAVRHGDEWIVNGQKVWTSGAQRADYGMLIARTDWDVPKHQGITWFVMPMRQPGVEVRPLKQMNRQQTFNEVFFTDARVPHENAVGRVNGGWQVALTTLAHERAGSVRAVEAPQRSAVDTFAGLSALAREAGRRGDAVVRQQLARIYVMERVIRLNAQRAAAARAAGRPPGPEGSLGKLARSDYRRAIRDLGMSLLGAGGMLDGEWAPLGGAVAMACLSTPSSSIAGGTDEVQRNILGERVLGLPKEPQVDRDPPFREVKQNRQNWSVTAAR